MPTRFRQDKATQAAALFLHHEGGEMNHMKLIKLMYFADRLSLVRWGRPITFDWYYSLKHGPVLSYTLDLVNSEVREDEPTYWHSLISEREHHDVRLLVKDERPPVSHLSEAEEKVIEETYLELGELDQWQLRDRSHELPEWRDPQGSRIPIPRCAILMAEGYSADEAQEVEDMLNSAEEAYRVLGA